MANEKRLIYADYGQESVEYLKKHLIVGDSDFLRGYLQGVEALANGLAKLPSVDAVEVVHGRWEKAEYSGFLRCDQCKDVYINEEWLEDGKWNYCPNCGAKMDRDT